MAAVAADDLLIGVPDGWSADQIASYQKYWDSYFSGEAGRRRRAKFVPGAVAKSYVQTKEPELKSAFEQWFFEAFHGSVVARTTETWNHVHAAKEDLQRRLATFLSDAV